MRTFNDNQFRINELIERIYGVICAHHDISDEAMEKLAEQLEDPQACVSQHVFSVFGRDSENPMHISYVARTWIHPDYDRTSFDPTADNEIEFVYVIESITFYDDEQEKKDHLARLQPAKTIDITVYQIKYLE